jgi:hypothetical protein
MLQESHMLLKLMVATVLGFGAAVVAQVATPSFSQGVVDTVLIMCAGGILKLLQYGRKTISMVQKSHERTDMHELRLNNHRDRLYGLDKLQETLIKET